MKDAVDYYEFVNRIASPPYCGYEILQISRCKEKDYKFKMEEQDGFVCVNEI